VLVRFKCDVSKPAPKVDEATRKVAAAAAAQEQVRHWSEQDGLAPEQITLFRAGRDHASVLLVSSLVYHVHLAATRLPSAS
jgi:hypothetical protein